MCDLDVFECEEQSYEQCFEKLLKKPSTSDGQGSMWGNYDWGREIELKVKSKLKLKVLSLFSIYPRSKG